MDKKENWYKFINTGQVDTPALIIYRQRVINNIEGLKKMVSSPDLLRPHVKTNKSVEATRLMMHHGISKFKCATVAEAEMLGICEVEDALLAYQPTFQKLERFVHVIQKYPKTKFSCLVDNSESAVMISEYAGNKNIIIPVFIDLNVGMNRTGISPEKAINLYKQLTQLVGINFVGFHTYDGHIRDKQLTERIEHCNRDFEAVEKLRSEIELNGHPFPLLVAGGSPTFAIHSKRKNVECSPGTFIFWDKGYYDSLPEQNFEFAALVLARVISLSDESKVCIDLGYKAIASENDLQNRVYFLNAPQLVPLSHSEEHMVIEVGKNHEYKIGDEFYCLPIHICPTVAMYDKAYVVHDEVKRSEWKINARGREIM